jgi:hypothetical protein
MRDTVLAAGTVKRIHVRRDRVAKLAKGCDLPVLVVQTSKGPYYGREVSFGQGAVLTQKRKQLSCGARVYVETRGEVTIRG